MFGTWKYNRETQEVQSLPQVFDPVTGRSSQHHACNRCHEKKLKCSGEKTGCKRCLSNKLSCEYTRSSSRRGTKKTGRRSPASKSGQSSSKPETHSRSATTGLVEEENTIDQLDLSWLGPENDFDFTAYDNDRSGYGAIPDYEQYQWQQDSNALDGYADAEHGVQFGDFQHLQHPFQWDQEQGQRHN